MRTMSENYLNYIKSSLVRRPKSKFVVDNVSYAGDKYLVTYPKIEHKTEKAIGSFPAKTCELEIYDKDGTFDLHGKEVTVYRGLEIDGKTEWARSGVFLAFDDNIKTNINKKTITFKGVDKTQLLDKPYGGSAQWEVSRRILHIVKEICTRNGIELASAEFPLNTYVFPDIPSGLDFENITDRQMIAYIAELGGCIAMFTHNGKLTFRKETDTGVTLPRTKYKNLSVENVFGPINAISFGHNTYEDSLLYTQNDEVTDETKVEWAINDNPLTTTTDRENLIQLASEHFFGRSFVPFELEDIIDDYIFDLNDTVTVEKKDNSTVKVTLLELSTSSRIKSKFGASLQIPGKTNTALAGSVKERLGKVELLVDHQNKIISILVSDGEARATAIKQNADAISTQAKKLETLINDFNGLDIEGTVKTEVTKEAIIELLADKVSTNVGANYISKSDLDDYVKTQDFETEIEATEKSIKAVTQKIETIENAGYITESAAKSFIEVETKNITAVVTESLKRANKNLFIDSECFGSATVSTFRSQILKDEITTDEVLPLRKVRQISFWGSGDILTNVGFTLSSEHILGQKAGEIDKLEKDKTYALSFKAKIKWADDIEKDLSLTNFLYVGSGITAERISNSGFALSSEWRDFNIVFKLSDNPADFQLRFFIEAAMSMAYTISFSSFMLVESDTPVEWVPDAEAIDQSVEAKLSLYVKTDTDGNLVSAIHAKANQITIESDNFTLDGEGNMTCNNANITGGKLFSGAEDTHVLIEDGQIKQVFGEEQILKIGVETSVLIPTSTGYTSVAYTELVYKNGIRFNNNQGGIIDISRQSWGYGDKISEFERDMIKSSGGLVVSANGSANALILAGSSVWLCGKLYFTNYRYHHQDKMPLYVNTDGEITT